jgi:hypothetical protein
MHMMMMCSYSSYYAQHKGTASASIFELFVQISHAVQIIICAECAYADEDVVVHFLVKVLYAVR